MLTDSKEKKKEYYLNTQLQDNNRIVEYVEYLTKKKEKKEKNMWSLGFWLLDSDIIVQTELNCSGDIKPLQTQNVSTLNPDLGNSKTKHAQNLRLHDSSCLLPLHQISPYIQIQKLEYCNN